MKELINKIRTFQHVYLSISVIRGAALSIWFGPFLITWDSWEWKYRRNWRGVLSIDWMPD